MADIEISEKMLEDLIVEHALNNEGELPHTGETWDIIKRQVKLGNYGIVDILCISAIPAHGIYEFDIDVKIIELKKGCLNASAISQISRYRTGVERIINEIYKDRNILLNVRGDIIGAKFDENDDSCFASDHIEWIDACVYSIGINEGVKFNDCCGWYKTEIGNTEYLKSMLDDAQSITSGTESSEEVESEG